jgi:hypothetical protein
MKDLYTPNAIVVDELEDVPIPIRVKSDEIVFDINLSTKTKNYDKKVIKKYFDSNLSYEKLSILEHALGYLDNKKIIDDIYNAVLFNEVYRKDNFYIYSYSERNKKAIIQYQEPKTKQQRLI